MGIPVLAGRDFTSSDIRSAAPVVIVNHTFAAREWPGQDPVGRRLRTGGAEPWMTIVGVVGDIRHRGPSTAPRPELYQPHTQRSFSFMSFVVRTRQDPARTVPAIRAEISRLDPSQPISGVATMDEHLARALSRPRFMSTLVVMFGVLALTLSMVGVYGVMAYSVTQRTREIAIRMALGARAGTVVAMILSRTACVAGIGIGVGLFGAALFTRALSGLLFGVGASDVPTFATAAGLLGGAALVAGAIPAFRATRIDGAEALKL
jgi:putative ABC transport system permease protein